MAVVAGLLLSACAPGRIVLPITIEPPSPATAVDADEFTSHEAAVRGIAAVMAADLGLPVPGHVTLYVYASRRVFEAGLVRDGRVTRARAAELGDFAVGVSKRGRLLLNAEASEPRGREWFRLIAHELTHVAQIELTEGESLAEQWLAEGMAEWVAFTVLERLWLDTVANRRVMALGGIRTHAALVSARLDLETLGNPRGFTVRHLREGSTPTYQLAFLMADYLITRDGFSRVLDYFRSFARSQDRRANFARAFGQSLEEFEQEVLRYLAAAVR